jgi:hypothetical protein
VGVSFSLELDHNTHAQSPVSDGDVDRPRFVVIDAATSGCGATINIRIFPVELGALDLKFIALQWNTENKINALYTTPDILARIY